MTAIYRDAGRPVHERVADLLARMTPEEKFAQMHAYWLILDEHGSHRERSQRREQHTRCGRERYKTLAQKRLGCE